MPAPPLHAPSPFSVPLTADTAVFRTKNRSAAGVLIVFAGAIGLHVLVKWAAV